MTTARIIVGDVRTVLGGLPERSVQLCMTSPPYWALRSYLPADHAAKALEMGSEPTPEAYIAGQVEVFRAALRGSVRPAEQIEGKSTVELIVIKERLRREVGER